MEPKTFFEHYRICEEDRVPVELGRVGSFIAYKAVDTRFGEPVVIKRIPVASVDPALREQFQKQARDARVLDHVNIAKLLGFGIEDDHFVFVSEYIEGETLGAWIAAHGPMPPEAVLRVALQVVNALAAASFHSVTHRAIQPSNLAIVSGEMAEGGWPFVKLTNFGVAGLKLEPDSEVSPVAPQFVSPEQWQLGMSDFRSEIYSLGATMCFLLTGVIHSPEARLQKLKQFPRALRNLLAHMLQDNPDERPQDPVVFAEAIRECQVRVQRRQELKRRFGIPLVPVISKTRERPPQSRVWLPRRPLAIAALVLALATLAGVLWPENFQRILNRNRDISQIGVPIGVPDASPAPVVQNSDDTFVPPLAQTNASPVSVAPPATNQSVTSAPKVVQPSPASNSTNTDNPKTTFGQVAANDRTPEPPPPTEGPDDLVEKAQDSDSQQLAVTQNANVNAKVAPAETASQSPAKNEKQADVAATSAAKAGTREKIATSTAKRRSPAAVKRTRIAQMPPLHYGSVRARVLGTTPDGNLILGLPSGETKIVPPPPSERYERRRVFIERRRTFILPFQPFAPMFPPGG